MGRWTGMLGRPWRGAAAVATAIVLGGCGLVGGAANFRGDVPYSMIVTSPDFSQGVMGRSYTCHGRGRHPGIHWSGAPQGTKSIALVMDDSAAPITPYIYWIVFDIPPRATGIQAGQIPPGRQATNSSGSVGYDPPCPANQGRQYLFTVYALGSMLKLPDGAGTKAAWEAIAQTTIARGRVLAAVNP